MKSSVLPLVFLLLILLFSLGVSYTGDEPIENLPGYVDFGSMKEFQDSESSVEVTLKDPLLSVITKATRKDNPELFKLLSGLKLIQVHTYSLKTPKSKLIKERADKLSLELQKKGWERIVKAKEPKEKDEIYIKTAGERIAGLVVLSIQYGDEVTFVNIVGDIDPDSLDKLSSQFYIPGLDSLNLKTRGEK